MYLTHPLSIPEFITPSPRAVAIHLTQAMVHNRGSVRAITSCRLGLLGNKHLAQETVIRDNKSHPPAQAQHQGTCSQRPHTPRYIRPNNAKCATHCNPHRKANTTMGSMGRQHTYQQTRESTATHCSDKESFGSMRSSTKVSPSFFLSSRYLSSSKQRSSET